MAIKRYKPEQIVTLLRQIEVGIANGKPTSISKRHSSRATLPNCDRSMLQEGVVVEFSTNAFRSRA